MAQLTKAQIEAARKENASKIINSSVPYSNEAKREDKLSAFEFTTFQLMKVDKGENGYRGYKVTPDNAPRENFFVTEQRAIDLNLCIRHGKETIPVAKHVRAGLNADGKVQAFFK